MPGEAMTMQAAMTHMGAAHDAPTPAQPDRHLLICCTPRTASATLASLLSAGGNLCHSAEYFSVPAEKRYNLRPSVAPAPVRRGAINPGYFHRILPLRTSHGVFSTRVHASHLKRVTAAGLGRELLDKAVLVYLCRGKLQDQAISYTIAQVTKDWGNHEQHSLKNEPDMQKLTAVYVRNLRWLVHQNSKWQATFAMLGKPVLEVTTEDLTAHPADTTLAVMEHVGIDADRDALRIEAGKRQRYASHAELKQQLKQEITTNLDPLELLADRYRLSGRWRDALATLLD